MQYSFLGDSKIKVSKVILGAWAIGGWMWGGTDESDAINAIETAFDAGINAIDTAPIYGFGKSEEIIGNVIKNRRDKVVIATKGGLVWNTLLGEKAFNTDYDKITDTGNIKVRRFLGKNSLVDEVNQSLKRLKTDYIDLYQTHWQEATTPIEETIEALLMCKKAGKIREIGVCNATVDQIMKYREFGNIVSDQEKYNMIDRKAEISNIGYCKNSKLSFLAYSPISYGLLAKRFTKNSIFTDDDLRKKYNRFKGENIEKINTILESMDNIKEKYNLSYSALALAWVLNKSKYNFVLAGGRKSEHILDNVKAGDCFIEEKDMDRIDNIIGGLKKYE